MAKDLVEVELFKDHKDYKDDVFVCVNGKNIVVKRGEKVKIERKYYEALENSKKQDKATADLIAKKQDEFLEETRNRNM
ncbi:MAG: hypothetical protein U0L73_02680 [Ruminococcus bromii]|nr:hypothetical protein [Ruminococcus bromii]